MYCPQCGSEAGSGPLYCRSCGLALSAVEAALDDRLAGAAEHLRGGARAVKVGLSAMVLFALVAAVAAASSGPFDVTVGPLLVRVSDWGVSLVLALLSGIPAVGLGYRRIRRAAAEVGALAAPGDAGERARLEAGPARAAVGAGETRRGLKGAVGSEDATARLERGEQ
jgi:hypothetical protein